MKNNKILILLVLAFVLVLGGAALLYDHLSQDAPDYLATQDGAVSSPGAGSSSQPSASSSQPASSSEEEEDASMRILAPDFTVLDLEGNEVRLSDYLGRPVVLNFWASWCGPCKSEMPDFNEAYLELGEHVQFLMINVTDGSRETLDSASEFIAQGGYAFPVFYDTQLSARNVYGATSLPTTFFIDADGYVAAWANGMISRDVLQTGIDMIYTP